MNFIRSILTFLFLFAGGSYLYADSIKFLQIDLKKEIGSTTWVYIQKGFQKADSLQVSGIILNMNTYGGTVVHADSIRTTILNSDIPVYAFIDNNAASAGALIAIACDSIYMRKGANIGAATVVNQTGEQMPDKYQSYMRATIRSTAEAHGHDTVFVNGKPELKWRRDPVIAEAMVDERVIVPNVIDSGRVLTFTTEEAIKHGYCEGTADDIDDIIRNRLHIDRYGIIVYKPSRIDEVLGWLTSPGVQAVLIMIIVLGIYYELRTPGIGIPSIGTLIAAILYFAPLYIEGLAANWEILVFVSGMILLAVEIFIIPGFGIAGIGGIILMFGALILALLNNVDFDFGDVPVSHANRAVLTVVAGLGLGFVLMIYLAYRVGQNGFLQKMALSKEEKVSEGYIAVSVKEMNLIGHTGVAGTILRPSGKVIIDNEYYDAVAMYGYIDKGSPIKVVKYEQAQLYVIQIN